MTLLNSSSLNELKEPKLLTDSWETFSLLSPDSSWISLQKPFIFCWEEKLILVLLFYETYWTSSSTYSDSKLWFEFKKKLGLVKLKMDFLYFFSFNSNLYSSLLDKSVMRSTKSLVYTSQKGCFYQNLCFFMYSNTNL